MDDGVRPTCATKLSVIRFRMLCYLKLFRAYVRSLLSAGCRLLMFRVCSVSLGEKEPSKSQTEASVNVRPGIGI